MDLLPLLFEQDPYVRRIRRWSSVADPEELVSTIIEAVADNLKEIPDHMHTIEQDTAITVDKDYFQESVDVQQFKPEEISVKLTANNTVTVECKHEERQDEHGYISRHFVRKYVLPEDCDVKQLRSRLSSDGVLSISAPKKQEGKQLEYREIPIIKTGRPVKRIKRLQHVDGSLRESKKMRKPSRRFK